MHLLKHRFGPILVCLVLVAAGCAVWRQVGAGQGLRFNHQLHQSVECTDCHTQTGTEAKAGMPDLETCAMCHEEIDKPKPPERQVASLFSNGVYKAANVTAIPSETIFSHKNHTVDHKVACTQCHTGIQQSTAITAEVRVDMADCMTCHAKAPNPAVAANDCATCHQTIRKDVKPPTHHQNWTRLHGQKAKDGDRAGANDCTICHTQDSCTTCHQTQAPAGHTATFKNRGHGVAASIDRENCTTCHQADTCASCHQTTSPRSHRGQWGSPRDNHCVNCHVPVANEGCAVCHQGGTPSHARALPTPATMVGTDCRSCHGVVPNAKLPHVDNGDNCTYCHH